MKKRIFSLGMCLILLFSCLSPGIVSSAAEGPTYTKMEDVYYTLDGCIVYAEPSYAAAVLTVIGANVPVRVVGKYSNGWYRINIGAIGYCKMDSLTTTWDISNNVMPKDTQAFYAKQTADELGYSFHNMVLNSQKVIKKDIFNSYVGQKAILFAKIDDQVAVSFKMLYADKVKKDIYLDFYKYKVNNGDRSQTIELIPSEDTELWGQIAIFQIRVGYDKAADMYIWDMENAEYNLMNTYYTEFSEFAYAPVTQVSNMQIVHCEIENSLNAALRNKMADLRKGIKYLNYDEKAYRNSIHSRLRKDTEYVDYDY